MMRCAPVGEPAWCLERRDDAGVDDAPILREECGAHVPRGSHDDAVGGVLWNVSGRLATSEATAGEIDTRRTKGGATAASNQSRRGR
jgi:hypothetical protein